MNTKRVVNYFFELHAPLYGEYDAVFNSLFYNKSVRYWRYISQNSDERGTKIG